MFSLICAGLNTSIFVVILMSSSGFSLAATIIGSLFAGSAVVQILISIRQGMLEIVIEVTKAVAAAAAEE